MTSLTVNAGSVWQGGLRKRTFMAVVGLLTVALFVSACSSGPTGDTVAGMSSTYTSSDKTVSEYAPADRGEPVEFEGTTDTGIVVSNEDYAGQVLVVNFWYAACGPCRAEAPDLRELHEEYQDKGVKFLGVNVYDEPETALAFARKYGITYPSVIDKDDGDVRLAFAGHAPPSAVPTTLVLDKAGRVAARFVGQIQAPSSLAAIIRKLTEEA
ncbi:thiol-disulfide isomerase/thioredoxin [Homoserinimonas aerilata]|uniref:Thiol-disulfide isomerase/thioredoxin n=1 Tax=Homoserinimonas aerilata TaxID=1162970 RepID=A0A542YH42_9MICO|nr:TlpA disulfide reductase family protein [Homoserinimonas aerilata]TQL47419.1 thiol-disulfide isomerase/thioredoxin [Homoserinimonas aerilata]